MIDAFTPIMHHAPDAITRGFYKRAMAEHYCGLTPDARHLNIQLSPTPDHPYAFRSFKGLPQAVLKSAPPWASCTPSWVYSFTLQVNKFSCLYRPLSETWIPSCNGNKNLAQPSYNNSWYEIQLDSVRDKLNYWLPSWSLENQRTGWWYWKPVWRGWQLSSGRHIGSP